jgi:hypothetical protein
MDTRAKAFQLVLKNTCKLDGPARDAEGDFAFLSSSYGQFKLYLFIELIDKNFILWSFLNSLNMLRFNPLVKSPGISNKVAPAL